MQYPYRLLHSIELSRFSSLLMPNSKLCMLLIELSFRLVQWPPTERTMSLAWVYLGVSWPPTPEDIPDPSHGRVFREKFRSVNVVKGVWSLLTDLLLNRHQKIKKKRCAAQIGRSFMLENGKEADCSLIPHSYNKQ